MIHVITKGHTPLKKLKISFSITLGEFSANMFEWHLWGWALRNLGIIFRYLEWAPRPPFLPQSQQWLANKTFFAMIPSPGVLTTYQRDRSFSAQRFKLSSDAAGRLGSASSARSQRGNHSCQIRSDQISCSVVSDSLRPHESQHARPPCPSPSPRVHSNSCPSSRWCHPAISSSVIPFSSCPQSLPASESFPMSQLFAWGGQRTGVSASASFLPKKSQGWSPSEWTGWIFLQSKGLSRGFSNTTVQKHQFFSTQPSSQSNSHIHTWLLEKP